MNNKKRLPAPFPFSNQPTRHCKRPYVPSQPSHRTEPIAVSSSFNPPLSRTPSSANKNSNVYQDSIKPYHSAHTSNAAFAPPPKYTPHYQQSTGTPSTYYGSGRTTPNSIGTTLQNTMPYSTRREPLTDIGNTGSASSRNDIQKTQPISNKKAPLQVSTPHLKHQTHVLTTTSQGLQYWSQFKSYCHLLFEIIGVMDSQATVGDYGCQQFMLKTSDGVIKCQYWEIDNKLLRLYRGKSYRVIGNWDSVSKALKCVKVRQSTALEEQFNTQLVKQCDLAMKELSCSINEM